MHGTYLIEIAFRKDAADPVGRGLAAGVRHGGWGKIKDVRASQLYRFVGDLSRADLRRIAEELLCDPVLQTHSDGAWTLGATSGAKRNRCFAVDVWYKAGVTDAAGESVLKGVEDLGISNVGEVRAGARYRFWGLKNKEKARQVTLALIANPLVHDYVIYDY